MRHMIRRSWIQWAWIGSIFFLAAGSAPVRAEDVNVTLINVILEGEKIWLPSAVVVKEGQKVHLKLINKLDKDHGVAIAAANVKEGVKATETREIEFQAPAEGVYPIQCQIHSAHLGSVLIVTK